LANVGALRTTISLDSAQFTQSMAGVNRQLKSLEQEQKAVTSSGTGFARGVEELKKKSDVLNRTLELQQAKVKELRRRYEESKKATGENSKETQNAMLKYQKASAELNKTENALKGVTDELNRQTNPWLNLSKNMTETGNKLSGIGDKMTKFGQGMTTKVSLPIAGLGGVMLKTGMDFEASMSNVQAISGATGNDLVKLEDKARQLGSTTSKSASEAADALGYMALAGWDTTQMMDGLEPILRLSEAGNIDLARASDLVTDSMSALQIEVKDLPSYLDMVAQASRKSNTNIDALMEAYLVAGGTMASFNVPLEESTALLGLLANRGLKGSEAGTALNAIMVNLTSGAGQAGKAMEELNISAFDADGQFIGLEETLRLVGERTKGMTDEQKAQYISMIAGKEHLKSFQGLLAGLDDEYKDLKTNISGADGSLNDMAKTMQDNTRGNIARLKSSFEELSIQVSEHLIPIFSQGIDKVTEIVEWFGDLDKSTQENIIKMSAFAMAIGPTSLALGGITKTAGNTLSVLGNLAGKVGTSQSGAGKASLIGSFGALAAGSGPLIAATAAIGGLTVGGLALYNHLNKDVIPEVDLFGDEVSKSTKQALGGFVDLNDQATIQLNELQWAGKTVSEEMAESLSGNFDEMGRQIVEGLENRKNESITALQNLFIDSKNITEEEQKNILQNVTTGYEDRKKLAEESYQKIIEIVSTAAQENREITEQEWKDINQIQQDGLETAIEILTETELEQKVIFEKIKQQSSEITKQQASEVIQNSVDQKDKVVAEANKQYELAVAEIIRQRDETGQISADQADKLIENAERQKTDTIKKAEEMHSNILGEAEKQNPKLYREVSRTTGRIYSKWENLAIDSGVKFGEIYTDGRNTFEGIKKVFGGVLEITAPTIVEVGNLYSAARTIFNSVRNIFSKKIEVDAPSMREPALSPKAYRSYSVGTDYHPGGKAFIGEEGTELVKTGNKLSLLDFGLYNLPTGSQVFTHDETKKILRSLNNIPAYANGISPSGEADRIANRLSQSQQLQGQAVIYTTVINQMDSEELSRMTYRTITELQELDKSIEQQFR
jgi:TP901 family phage tail tape measure protein